MCGAGRLESRSGTQWSSPLVAITAALAAALGVLSAALDEPGISVADSLNQLAADAAAAIPTYLGLSVTVDRNDPPFTFTTLADDVVAGDVRTSLGLALSGAGVLPAVVLVLYAGSPGTFVDLAADLAWLTARPLSDFVLDHHLPVSAGTYSGTYLLEASVVNQAIGALIGQGYTVQQADRQLDARAANAGISRHAASLRILANLAPPAPTTGV
jgi:hypothetical protein